MDPNPYQSPGAPNDEQISMPLESDAGPLRVCCECGHWVLVTPSKAGSKVSCPCGRPVVVPLLVEFRNRPDLLSAATIDRRIRRLIAKGELPISGGCSKCGLVVPVEVVPINVECERYTARAYGGHGVIYIPFLSLLWWWREEERVEIHGHDTDVQTPVCLCVPCQESINSTPRFWYFGFAVVTLGAIVGFYSLAPGIIVVAAGLLGIVLWKRTANRIRQRALKDLLCQVPVYGQLLSSYPDAAVVVPPMGKRVRNQ